MTPEQDRDDTTCSGCSYLHWVTRHVYGTSSTGPGCLRSGGHAIARCEHFTTDPWDTEEDAP